MSDLDVRIAEAKLAGDLVEQNGCYFRRSSSPNEAYRMLLTTDRVYVVTFCGDVRLARVSRAQYKYWSTGLEWDFVLYLLYPNDIESEGFRINQTGYRMVLKEITDND